MDYGVGVSVVNALSEFLELIINRDGKKYKINFDNGAVKNDLEIVGESEKNNDTYYTGTEITFLPSTKTFKNIDFNFGTVEKKIKRISFFKHRCKYNSKDKDHPK